MDDWNGFSQIEMPEELGAAQFFPGALGFCPACAEVPDTCGYAHEPQDDQLTQHEKQQQLVEEHAGKCVAHLLIWMRQSNHDACFIIDHCQWQAQVLTGTSIET